MIYLFPLGSVHLTLADLRVHFRKHKLSDEFELKVPRFTAQGGAMIGLAGRSGEGKSTLLHVLGTLMVPPHADNAAFKVTYHFPGADGAGFVYDVTSKESSVESIRNLAFGFVFQQHFNLPCMTTDTNVALPHILRHDFDWKWAQPRCHSLLSHLRLDDPHHKKFPAELSGGMNQRVAICRALMHEPPFLFADEPTASLDAGLKVAVLKLLRRHADLGACVVIVSHELGDLARYCDRILVVGDGRLRFPFLDPDSDQTRALPALPPLPLIESNRPRLRNDEDVRGILHTLTPLVWSEGEVHAPAPTHAETLTRPAASENAPIQPRSQINGRPAMRKNIWAYALREVWGRRHRAAHLMTALMVILGTASFAYLADLSQGVVSYLKKRDLSAPDEFINRINVDATSNKNRLTAAQVNFLSELKGLRAPPTFYQSGEPIQFYPPKKTRREDVVRAEVVSVPIGDDVLQAVPLTESGTARMGVCYLSGGPFIADERDRAGVIVSRRFLRTRYWNVEDEDKPNPLAADPEELPSFVIVQLAGGGRWNPPGYNGRVRIPIKGVFEYPLPVIAAAPAGKEQYLPGIFVPDGFFRRLQTWEPAFALLYSSLDGRELIPDYKLVRQITLSVTKAEDPAWSKQESRSWYYLRYVFRDVPINPIRTKDLGMQVTLSPDQPEHRVEPAVFEKSPEWSKLRNVIEEDAKSKPAKIDFDTISAQSLAGRLPPLENLPPSFSKAVLRFTDMHDVPSALASIRHEYNSEMESEAPYAEAISKLSNIESLVGSLSWAMFGLFFAILIYVCVTTAYQHVLKKTADIGILRVHGLSPGAIARIYLVELAMLIWPAAIVGMILALGCAWISNDKVAGWVSGLGAPKTVPEAPMAMDGAIVFASLQEGWTRSALNLCLLSVGVLVVISATTLLTVRLIRRKNIVDCLRGSE